MKMPAIMFSCAIEELEEAVDNKRPISSLMKQKWIDDAGDFVGDCETLLRLFRSESTDAWERKIAAYYVDPFGAQKPRKSHNRTSGEPRGRGRSWTAAPADAS